MKTLLSGNSAVAMFHHINEQGKHFTRLHIYNRHNLEWVYNSFIMVRSDEPGFTIQDVQINGNRAVLYVLSQYFEGQLVYFKNGENWEYQRRLSNSKSIGGFGVTAKPWLHKLYHFLGLTGTVGIPAAQ